MAVESTLRKAVQDYWEDPDTISIIDKNLHQIEIDTVSKYLLPGDHLADIGCGNGAATVAYASKVKSCVAVERSNRLRNQALENAFQAGIKNITFTSGDVLDLADIGDNEFDAVVTQRMLINLTSWHDQQKGIANIHRILKPGGRYIMVENTNEAFANLNDMRRSVDLAPIPQHWHNRFFGDESLRKFLCGKFQILRHHNFNLYYFLTRVFVPMFASFTGYGKNAKKDPIFKQADEAARVLFEKYTDCFRLPNGETLGPIQAFVLRKENA